MQAAITASKEGHKVTLCEKDDHLGGVLVCERNVPFKKPVDQYLEQQKYLIAKANIDVRLNTEVTPEMAQELAPDVIIAALGATASLPPILGIDGANVMTAENAFAHPELVKDSAVILGAGLTGIELGIYLAELGKKIEVVEKADVDDSEWNAGHMAKLSSCGVPARFNHEVVKITEDGIVCNNGGNEVELKAGTVIVALGMNPRWDEAEALSTCAGEFYQVGDCRAPRNMLVANGEGWTAAKQIGRY